MRLFVGVPPSDEAGRALDAYSRELRGPLPDAWRWVPLENLHYTVLFIGEVDDGDVEGVQAALRHAVRGLGPFEMSLGETGRFPPRGRARVLWVGAGSGAAELAEANARVAHAVQDRVPRDDRPFSAHLTLARAKPAVGLAMEALPRIQPRPPSWKVGAIVLYRSRLMRPAPVYETVLRIPLPGAGDAEVLP